MLAVIGALTLVSLSTLAVWVIYDLAADNIAGAFRDAFAALQDVFRP